MKQTKNRIFIGLSETSGYYGRLYEGLVQAGTDCFFAPIAPNKHQYGYRLKTNILVKACQATIVRSASSANILLKALWRGSHECLKLCLLIWALFRFDIFIFNGGNCFWGVKDIWIYKLLKKRLVFICLGSLTRLPFTDGSFVTGIYTGKKPSIEDFVSESIKRQKKVDIIEIYTDIFLNLPSQAQLNRKKYVSLCNIGIPVGRMPEDTCHRKAKSAECTVKILHAPSYIGCRGTYEFKKILDELKEEGLSFQYTEVSGVKNEELMKQLQECDFLIDELYSDTPMATLAEEAAFYGKPSVVAGYFAEKYVNYYEKDLIPPSLYVTPENIKQAIRKMIEDKEFREELGKKAQLFVKKNCTSQVVAEKISRVIAGDIPETWIMNPGGIDNLYGYGLSRESIKEIVSEIVKIGGKKKLEKANNSRALEAINRFSDMVR